MATVQASPIFLEKTGAERWVLTIHDEEIPFHAIPDPAPTARKA